MNKEILDLHREITKRIFEYGGRVWKECTIHLHGEIKLKVIPEVLSISLAHYSNGFTIINSNRIKIETLLELLNEFEKKPIIMYFGNRNFEIPGIRKVKIKMSDVREGSKLFSKILSTYSIYSRPEVEIEEEVMSLDDVDELSNVILMAYTPPEIREKMKLKLKEAMKDKFKFINEVAGIIGGLIVNPMFIAPRGFSILQSAIKNLGKNDEKYKLLIHHVIENVKKEKLIEFIDENDRDLSINDFANDFSILICDVENDIYKPLQLFLIWSFIKSIKHEKVVVLSYADEVIKIKELIEAIKKISIYNNLKMIYLFHGDEDSNEWFGDKSIIFDIKTSKLLELVSEEKASNTAQLLSNLGKLKENNFKNNVRFIAKYMDGMWKLENINRNMGLIKFVGKLFMKIVENAI